MPKAMRPVVKERRAVYCIIAQASDKGSRTTWLNAANYIVLMNLMLIYEQLYGRCSMLCSIDTVES